MIAALSELLRGRSVYPLQFIAAGKPQWLVLEEMQSGTESHDCMRASPLPAQGMVLPTAGLPVSINAIDETPLNMAGQHGPDIPPLRLYSQAILDCRLKLR